MPTMPGCCIFNCLLLVFPFEVRQLSQTPTFQQVDVVIRIIHVSRNYFQLDFEPCFRRSFIRETTIDRTRNSSTNMQIWQISVSRVPLSTTIKLPYYPGLFHLDFFNFGTKNSVVKTHAFCTNFYNFTIYCTFDVHGERKRDVRASNIDFNASACKFHPYHTPRAK